MLIAKKNLVNFSKITIIVEFILFEILNFSPEFAKDYHSGSDEESDDDRERRDRRDKDRDR